MNTEHMALVAGDGILPIAIYNSIKAAGATLPQIYLLSSNTSLYDAEGIPYKQIKNPLAVTMVLTKMRLAGICRLMMAGRVPKKDIYSEDRFDEGAREILSEVQDRNDHNLLAGVVKFIEKFGIKVVNYDDVIPEMLAKEGHIAGPIPTEGQNEDCAYGLEILKVLLPLSFGQSIVISNRAVVAVEAMEGTDQMVRRAGTLSRRGILIKGMRADQDRRYDLPVVGVDTLRTMYEAGLSALFVESGCVLLLEKDEFIKEAERLNISVTGVSTCQFL